MFGLVAKHYGRKPSDLPENIRDFVDMSVPTCSRYLKGEYISIHICDDARQTVSFTMYPSEGFFSRAPYLSPFQG